MDFIPKNALGGIGAGSGPVQDIQRAREAAGMVNQYDTQPAEPTIVMQINELKKRVSQLEQAVEFLNREMTDRTEGLSAIINQMRNFIGMNK